MAETTRKYAAADRDKGAKNTQIYPLQLQREITEAGCEVRERFLQWARAVLAGDGCCCCC